MNNFYDEKSNKWNEYENLMKKISDKLNYKLKSVITDIKSVIGGKLAEKIGIKENELPSIRIIDTSGNYMKDLSPSVPLRCSKTLITNPLLASIAPT